MWKAGLLFIINSDLSGKEQEHAGSHSSELDKAPRHVENVVRLLDEGNTIPFIARYRKELHGAMDDTALRNLEERLQYLRNLAERREAVKRSIE